ncbi:MAG: hypothetical protein VB092_05135 [Oscillospiraceae bacterium]|nr:hypothetical protein [Oscillospiraceae bacterium]
MRNKRIDFYRVYNAKPARTESAKKRLLLLLPPAALLLTLLIMLGVMTVRYVRLGAQIEAEQSYLSDAEVTAQYARYQSLSEELSEAVARRDALAQAKSAADSYPAVDAALITEALGAAQTVSVDAYSYDDAGGVLALSGSCTSASDAAQYAKALDALGKFSYVGYYGYASQSGRSYTFTMQCILQEAAQ